MAASSDRAYEFFWRQTARWLASPSPDPVAITVPDAPEPGDAISIDVDARDATFASVPDAAIDATLTSPGGAAQPLKLRHADATSGRFTAAIRPEHPGLYRIRAEARRGAASLGTADRWMYVGGADREFADPRLNEGFLRRVARTSGGRYVRAAEASRVPALLTSAILRTPPRAPRFVARAVGVRADCAAAVGRVDPAPALGTAMTRLRPWRAEAHRRRASASALAHGGVSDRYHSQKRLRPHRAADVRIRGSASARAELAGPQRGSRVGVPVGPRRN